MQQRMSVAVLDPEARSVGTDKMEQLRTARVITAIKTPYTAGGKFDLDAFDRLVQIQIENGTDGLIIGGTTGEGQLMQWSEHVMLIAHTVNSFGRDLLVIGNTGSNSTREALHATEQGFAVGMDAALHINPYYGKTSETGLLRHFRAVLDEGPAMIYNVPGRTGQDIPNSVVEQLAELPTFLGVKECTGVERIRGYTAQGIKCWTGNDDEAFESRHSAGAVGAVSVASNLIPGLYSKMMREDDKERADSVADLINWLFCQPNPIPLNTALAMCGLVQPVFRLPYVPLSREERERGAELLRAALPHLPGVKEVKVLEDDDFECVSWY